jgi:geranylgeranyl diphosphate/geranylgeranyl-bacteriochlorophyllide a reductase
MQTVVIVGGGPAGALAGERLARAGFSVTIFDEHLAWEKPCGGGLTQKAIRAYPFLLTSPHPKKLVHEIELISSGGHRARLALGEPIVIYSRCVLNGLLLERAEQAGCRVVRARVTAVEIGEGRATVVADRLAHAADFAVLAAGARNRFLPAPAPPLAPAELEITLGYFVPRQEELMKIKFLRGFEGYLWSFPRRDHLSVGICAKMEQPAETTGRRLRRHLERFMEEEKLPLAGASFYSHLLPSPGRTTLSTRRLAGPRWALVGDAAACVDPITGEGLYYALRSGEILAESLAAAKPEEYPARLRRELAEELERATRLAARLFRGNFFGAAVTTRMVQFARRSPTFRRMLREIFSGAQGYAGLNRRLWAQFGATIAEIAISFLRAAPAVEREG